MEKVIIIIIMIMQSKISVHSWYTPALTLIFFSLFILSHPNGVDGGKVQECVERFLWEFYWKCATFVQWNATNQRCLVFLQVWKPGKAHFLLNSRLIKATADEWNENYWLWQNGSRPQLVYCFRPSIFFFALGKFCIKEDLRPLSRHSFMQTFGAQKWLFIKCLRDT